MVTFEKRNGGLLIEPSSTCNQRRLAYWWNPSRVLWQERDSRELGTVALEAGFFVDASQFRAWRTEGLRVPAWADQAGIDAYGVFATFRVKDVVQRLRWIWPGRFLMGSPENEPGRKDNEPQHAVILTRGFWLAETACTQALWQAAMGENPSEFQGEQQPVERVSWNDTQDFIRRLNGVVPGLAARLPTEAEWEYACRAGTTTPFSFGEGITPEQVSYDGCYFSHDNKKRKKPVEVASLPANPWGLYEMHGNVWEWCQDWYDEPEEIAMETIDPIGPATGVARVLRGGCWFSFGHCVRSAVRDPLGYTARIERNGFRLAL